MSTIVGLVNAGIRALCHALAKPPIELQNSRSRHRSAVSASPSRSELPPASAIAPQQFKRARRALAARGIEFQSFGAHSSPGIKERLNRPPSGFHAFGALKKNVVAYHAIVDQGLIAGCGLGLEVVLVKKLHLYAVDPDQRPRDLGVEAQRDPFCRLDADDEIVLSQLLDRGASKHRERGLAEFDRYFAGDARREETFLQKGSVIVGDVLPQAYALAGAYTPVPGGIGPLTIAMLMANTVRAAKLRRGLSV